VRTIGLARAKARIGMKNLACNIRRLGQLRRINPCPAWKRAPGNADQAARRHGSSAKGQVTDTKPP